MADLDTGTDELLARVQDGVAVLTLNLPERRNVLTEPMLTALAATLRAVEADDDVGCVVLTGAGGAFCAGGDVKAMAEEDDPTTPRGRSTRASSASGRATARPRAGCTGCPPTIAALPGAAAGAGLALALACDLRYAAQDAVLTTAFARVGFAGDYGGTWFLTRLVGPRQGARALYFFSERLDAAGVGACSTASSRLIALKDEVLDRARRRPPARASPWPT